MLLQAHLKGRDVSVSQYCGGTKKETILLLKILFQQMVRFWYAVLDISQAYLQGLTQWK